MVSLESAQVELSNKVNKDNGLDYKIVTKGVNSIDLSSLKSPLRRKVTSISLISPRIDLTSPRRFSSLGVSFLPKT